MLLLVLLSLFPHTFLYFVLITSYAEKSVPGYNSISLKICFQLSMEFQDIPFNKIPPIFPKHAIFPTKLNVACKLVVTVFMSYKYLLLTSVKKKLRSWVNFKYWSGWFRASETTWNPRLKCSENATGSNEFNLLFRIKHICTCFWTRLQGSIRSVNMQCYFPLYNLSFKCWNTVQDLQKCMWEHHE